MNRPDRMTPEVVESLKQFAKRNDIQPVTVLSPDFTKWNSILDCYYFVYHDVYYGVELDGTIHT